MKRILFINHTGGLAGAETVFLDVITTSTTDPNIESFVICAADGNDQFKKSISHLPIRSFLSLPYRVLRNTPILALRNFIFSVPSIIFLLFYCLYKRIDIIYSNTSVNVVGIIIACILRKKHIWHIHELSTKNYRWIPNVLNKLYKRMFLYKKNHSVFVSNTTKLAWQEEIDIKINKSEIIYSKYKEIKLTHITKPLFTFGFLGSLIVNKNVDKLIDAFIKIENARLLIGGKGDKLEDLKEKVHKSFNENNILFLGHVINLSQFYSSIDVLVQVSLNESWGLVTLEAINAGIPVIMTQETGLKEILNNEEGCIFVDPNDTKLITQVMDKIMTDDTLRHRIINNGQKKLKSLNLNNNFNLRIKSLLHEI